MNIILVHVYWWNHKTEEHGDFTERIAYNKQMVKVYKLNEESADGIEDTEVESTLKLKLTSNTLQKMENKLFFWIEILKIHKFALLIVLRVDSH